MPRGPKGEKRPAHAIGAAIAVARIATGEAEDAPPDGKNKAGPELGRKGGQKRAEGMSAERRSELRRRLQPRDIPRNSSLSQQATCLESQ
jgi:hypothetical protein